MKLASMSQGLSHRKSYKWWVLAAILLGTLLTVIDLSSLNVALPTIGAHFGADLPKVQWVVLINSLTISALLLPMGRLSDMLGRKYLYIAGFAIFVGGSLIGALAVSLPMLILARAVQGVGSSMVQANFNAMALSVFPGTERGKVMGLLMSTVGTGTIIGPGIGGVLVDALGWRSVFYATGLIGIAAIAAVAVIVDRASFSQERVQGRRARFDWAGTALSSAAMLLFLLVITYGYKLGWSSPPIVAGLLLAVAGAAAFVWWELRVESPLLELRLFKRKIFALASAAAWLSFLGMGSIMFLMPFFLQEIQGYTPNQVGLIMIPSSLGMAIIAPIAGRLSDRWGWRWFTVGGLALSIAAMFAVAATLTPQSNLGLLIPLLMLRFPGHAVFNSPNNSSIFSEIERSRYGVISALTQVLRNSGTVTGIAIMTTIIVATMGSMGYEPRLEAVSAEAGAGVADAFVLGTRWAFLVLGLLFAVALACSFFKGAPAVPQPEAEPAPASPAPREAADPAR